MKSLDIFLVPYWVEEILKQQGASLTILTDYEKLKQYLSQENLIELLVFQETDLNHTKAHALNGASGLTKLLERWKTQATIELEVIEKEALARVNQAEYLLGLKQKLEPEDDQAESNPDSYQVIDMKGEDIALVVYPGYARISSRDFYIVIQKVLKIYYMYETTVKVASRPVFRLYVELMMRNRATE